MFDYRTLTIGGHGKDRERGRRDAERDAADIGRAHRHDQGTLVRALNADYERAQHNARRARDRGRLAYWQGYATELRAQLRRYGITRF
jgi:hypothetical protein